jgi:hypothetical protein
VDGAGDGDVDGDGPEAKQLELLTKVAGGLVG